MKFFKVINQTCRNCKEHFVYILQPWNRTRVHCNDNCRLLYNAAKSREKKKKIKIKNEARRNS